jgi:exonuclease SbcC
LELPEEGELPDGLILVRGPNSTGKSSLFEGILWGLWGPNAVDPTNEELISFASSFCNAVIVFEVDGIRYKIDRSYDPAQGTSAVLYVGNKNVWKKIADKATSVERKLEDILNLQLNQALNTLLVRQGEVAKIATASASDLRELLVKVYNIELLDQMSKHLDYFENDLSVRIRSLQDDYQRPDRILEKIEALKERLEGHKQKMKETAESLKELEKMAEMAPDEEILSNIELFSKAVDQHRRDYERATKELKHELEGTGLSSTEEEEIEGRIEYLELERERLKDLRDNLESDLSSINKKIGSIQGMITDLREKIELLKRPSASGDDAICPTCSKPLTLEERDNLVEDYETRITTGAADIETLKAQRAEKQKHMKKSDDRLAKVVRTLDAIQRITERKKQVDNTKSELEAQETELDEAIGELGTEDLDSLLAPFEADSLSDLKKEVAVLRAKIDSVERERGLIDENMKKDTEEIASLEKEVTRMKELGAQIESYQILEEHAKYVRRKLVRGFVSDWVFQKRLIGIIRKATNQYVRAFTNNQYSSVDLEPTPARGRSGAGLQLLIRDERDNATKKTSQLSFGDRTAISLGLRLGISRTMSGIRPLKDTPMTAPRVRSVLLDEPLGGLDKNRRISVVKTLVNDQSFEQIFLITHTDVQGWEGVPVVDITKSGNTSLATLQMSPQ